MNFYFIQSTPFVFSFHLTKMEEISNLKLILVGDYGIGKSALQSRFIYNKYPVKLMTIRNDFEKKVYSLDNKEYNIYLWDFLHHKYHDCILKTYFRGVDGYLLCFSLTNSESFKNVTNWCNLIKETADDSKIVLIGNKSDCISDLRVSEEEVKQFSEQLNLQYFPVSSKTGENVFEAFNGLIQEIMKKNEIEIPKEDEKSNCVVE